MVATGYFPQLPGFPLVPRPAPVGTSTCRPGRALVLTGRALPGTGQMVLADVRSSRPVPLSDHEVINLEVDAHTRITGLARNGLPYIGTGQRVPDRGPPLRRLGPSRGRSRRRARSCGRRQPRTSSARTGAAAAVWSTSSAAATGWRQRWPCSPWPRCSCWASVPAGAGRRPRARANLTGWRSPPTRRPWATAGAASASSASVAAPGSA